MSLMRAAAAAAAGAASSATAAAAAAATPQNTSACACAAVEGFVCAFSRQSAALVVAAEVAAFAITAGPRAPLKVAAGALVVVGTLRTGHMLLKVSVPDSCRPQGTGAAWLIASLAVPSPSQVCIHPVQFGRRCHRPCLPPARPPATGVPQPTQAGGGSAVGVGLGAAEE